MERGINTIIEETRRELTQLVNDKLQMGLPISVINLIVENVMFDIKGVMDNALKQEADKYQQTLQAQQEQVEWVEPTEVIPQDMMPMQDVEDAVVDIVENDTEN